MAITPSEEKLLRKQIRELFARNDELDKRQSEDIESLKKRVAALEKKVDVFVPKKSTKPKE